MRSYDVFVAFVLAALYVGAGFLGCAIAEWLFNEATGKHERKK